MAGRFSSGSCASPFSSLRQPRHFELRVVMRGLTLARVPPWRAAQVDLRGLEEPYVFGAQLFVVRLRVDPDVCTHGRAEERKLVDRCLTSRGIAVANSQFDERFGHKFLSRTYQVLLRLQVNVPRLLGEQHPVPAVVVPVGELVVELGPLGPRQGHAAHRRRGLRLRPKCCVGSKPLLGDVGFHLRACLEAEGVPEVQPCKSQHGGDCDAYPLRHLAEILKQATRRINATAKAFVVATSLPRPSRGAPSGPSPRERGYDLLIRDKPNQTCRTTCSAAPA